MKFQVGLTKRLIAMTLVLPLFGSCADISGGLLKSSNGMIIVDQLDMNASKKFGVTGVTDSGRQIFAHAGIVPPTKQGMGGGTGSFGGASVPEWVRVTWRQPRPGFQVDSTSGQRYEVLDFGDVLGDYKIEVAKRVPREVLAYANGGRGRALRLIFRIKDDGVLFAWDVQEDVKHPNGGAGWVYTHHGGDLNCEQMGARRIPDCTIGAMEDAPWYNPAWIR
jgi:hypothetical protein